MPPLTSAVSVDKHFFQTHNHSPWPWTLTSGIESVHLWVQWSEFEDIPSTQTWDFMFKRPETCLVILDLWPHESNQWICESTWTFVPNLKESSRGVLKKTCSQGKKGFVWSQRPWSFQMSFVYLWVQLINTSRCSWDGGFIGQGYSDLDLWTPHDNQFIQLNICNLFEYISLRVHKNATDGQPKNRMSLVTI